YFRFYLNRAILASDLGDHYYKELKHWKEMLELGLTTFAETPEPARSDCHAWSASPSYDFLSIIAGIRPTAPGFGSVVIKPNFGELKEVKASMPHPKGVIQIDLKKVGEKGVIGTVTIPSGIDGE